METNFKLTIISVRNFKGLPEDYDIMIEYSHRNMIFKSVNIVMFPKINIDGMTANHFQIETAIEPFTVLDMTLLAEFLCDLHSLILGENMSKAEAERHIEEHAKFIFCKR